MVAVMGPSGSGKSTLLTIAGSLEEPSSGEVLVGGAELSGMSRNDKARLRRRTVGYVFQDFNLLAGLTAAENVALPLELDGVTARKARGAGLQDRQRKCFCVRRKGKQARPAQIGRDMLMRNAFDHERMSFQRQFGVQPL